MTVSTGITGQFFVALLCVGCCTALFAQQAAAEQVSLVDDLGRVISLSAPAKRVISLAPNITENLYSAGAGQQIVGAVEYSDYPVEAQAIPSIGSYAHFNLETIIALQPDIIFAWYSGNGMEKINKLVELGLTVYISEPETLENVAREITNYGILTGNKEVAIAASTRYRKKLVRLKQLYSNRRPVTVFYQVWNKPLQTLNGRHLISKVINLCGGTNVFADVAGLAPKVSIESVLAVDPQAIVASVVDSERSQWLEEWSRWPSMQAVTDQHIYFVPADYLHRHTVRILLGAETVCEQLAEVRKGLPASGPAVWPNN